MNAPTAYLAACALGLAVTHAAIATTRAIDSHLSYNSCIAEQTAAGFNKQQAIAICAERTN
jgi:hypothetical protein